MHSEWRYSLVFTSVSSSRRCLQSAVADDVGHMILFECSVNLRESKNKRQKKYLNEL